MRKQRAETWGTRLFGELMCKQNEDLAKDEDGGITGGGGESGESGIMEAREGEHFKKAEVSSVRCSKE